MSGRSKDALKNTQLPKAKNGRLSGPIWKRSRTTGWRLGRYLSDMVPLAIKYCQEAGDGEDELQEACLQVRTLVHLLRTLEPQDVECHSTVLVAFP